MPKFDMTVTLGNLLTILAFCYAAYALFMRWQDTIKLNQEKLKLLEEWVEEHKKCNLTQIHILNEVRQSLAFIRGRMGLHGRIGMSEEIDD